MAEEEDKSKGAVERDEDEPARRALLCT